MHRYDGSHGAQRVSVSVIVIKRTQKQLNTAAECITTARIFGTCLTSSSALFCGGITLKEIIITQIEKNYDIAQVTSAGGLALAGCLGFAYFAHDNLREIRRAAQEPLPEIPAEADTATTCNLTAAPEQ